MSGRVIAIIGDGLLLCRPTARAIAVRLGETATATWLRIRRLQPASVLITVADRIETAFDATMRLVRAVARNRGIGLTGGLIWRGLAALTGIGITASLVTALSADGGEASLASLTIPDRQEMRPVRDVRLDPRIQPSANDAWMRIAKPIALFGLESPELDKQPPAYEAERSSDGMRRLDTLVFGGFDGERPHLHLRLLVDHAGEGAVQPFVVSMARGTARQGMSIQRSGLPGLIETKLGPVETADAALSDGSATRSCLIFRRSAGSEPLSFSGWWCGAAGRPADRHQLSCLIDRLDLLSAGDDRLLRGIFSRGELNRQSGCAPPRLSATGRKASWLDADGKAPALKAAAKR